MSLEINAQFNKFLEFAQSQANAASSTATHFGQDLTANIAQRANEA